MKGDPELLGILLLLIFLLSDQSFAVQAFRVLLPHEYKCCGFDLSSGGNESNVDILIKYTNESLLILLEFTLIPYYLTLNE